METAVEFISGIADQIKSFFSVFFENFFGSETQGPYSESYIWMANQFGHFFIGFGGLFLLSWAASYYFRRPTPSYSYGARMIDPKGRPTLMARTVWLLALVWLTIWMVKEWVFDYQAGIAFSSYLVDPYFDDLIWDTATDSFFYIAGISVALAHFGLLRISPIPVFLVVLVLAGLLASYWIPARERLETTGTPYFLRLSEKTFSGPKTEINPRSFDRQRFLEQLFSDDLAARSRMPSAMQQEDYPFQYLMEPQTERNQQLANGRSPLISRFFIALTNERVIRQAAPFIARQVLPRDDRKVGLPLSAPCNTRYITFRDLLKSRLVPSDDPGNPDWRLVSPDSEFDAVPDAPCPVQNAELLIIDQVPSTENAAALILSLIYIPPEMMNEASGDEAGTRGSNPSAPSDSSLAEINGRSRVTPERALSVFVRALPRKTVIWIIDSDRLINGWRDALDEEFDQDAISLIPLY